MKALIFLGTICLSASYALAGEIYGTITDSGKPVAAGIKVEIATAANKYTGETDKTGDYHVFVSDKGKAALTVSYKDQKPFTSVFSYDKSTRYDWDIIIVDGKMTLKRK
jgi:hypothetical protein